MADALVPMPAVSHGADVELTAQETLGWGGPVQSRLVLGRSDVVPMVAAGAVEDQPLAAYLKSIAQEFSLVRLTLRLTLQPALGESIEEALFSLSLAAPQADAADQPFVRALAPERLESGPCRVDRGIKLGFKAGVPGLPVEVEAGWSNATAAEKRSFYLVAYGLGTTLVEWRFKRTPTVELDGSYEVGAIVQLKRHVAAEAGLSIGGEVRAHHRRRQLEGVVGEGFSPVALSPG
jgi:hypothetical protein